MPHEGVVSFRSDRRRGAGLAELPGSAPLRILVAGEFNAGKSALIDAVARARVMPVADHPGQPLILRATSVRGAPRGALCVACGQDHLEGLEFIEIGLDPETEFTPAQTELIAACHLVIWVTIASQAWRLSEQVVLDRLAGIAGAPMILAVSRADKLRSDGDRDKIAGRLQRDTAGRFTRIIFVAAAARAIAASTDDPAQWQATSGAALHDLVMTHRAEQLRRIAPPSGEVLELHSAKSRREGAVPASAPILALLERIEQGIAGVILSGAVLHAGGAILSRHDGHPGIADLARACHRSALAAARLAPGGGEEILSETTLGGHLLLVQADAARSRTLFVLCRADRISRALALRHFRTCLHEA